VAGATLAFFIYVGVLIPVIPRLLEERLGGTEIDIGLSLASFSLFAIAARPALGRFGERHGLRTMMVGGALLAAAATAASTIILNRWVMLPLRGIQGIGEAALFVGAATQINAFAPPHRRAEAASYFSVAVFGGIGAGPIIGETVIGDGRFIAGLLVASAFAVLAGVVATFVPAGLTAHGGSSRSEAEAIPDHETDTTSNPPRYHPAALRPGAVMGLGIAGFAAFSAFMPAHTKALGLGGSQWVFAVYSVVCLVIRVAGAKLPERIGLARAVTIALVNVSLGLLMVAAVASPFGVYGGAVLVAIGMSFLYPSLLALAVNSVSEAQRVRVISTFTMFFEVGNVFGGVVIGGFAEATSKRGGFAAGAVAAAAGLWVLWRVLLPSMRANAAAALDDVPVGVGVAVV